MRQRVSVTAAASLLLIASGLFSTAADAALWSSTELHYQHGRLDTPSFIPGADDSSTSIFTIQNATGWKHVDLFVFVDIIDDRDDDGFNDSDLYGEMYVASGIGTWRGADLNWGPIRDLGPVIGLNVADDAKVRKYLPGIRLYWTAPGFAFLNTDITRYIDDSRGVAHGGAPSEDDSFMVDVAWAYPFDIGAQSFSIEGHMEYIGSRTNEFGGRVSHWILAQPQFRWDAGKAFFDRPQKLYLGVEWQYWRNKLGDPDTDESAVQALAVWKF